MKELQSQIASAERRGRLEGLDKAMDYAKERRQEYAHVAQHSKDAKKLAAESRELAYFDMMKEIDRLAALEANRNLHRSATTIFQDVVKAVSEGGDAH